MEALLLAEMRRLNDPYRLWNQPREAASTPDAAPTKTKKQGKRKSAIGSAQ
jgi:hypothetical protein